MSWLQVRNKGVLLTFALIRVGFQGCCESRTLFGSCEERFPCIRTPGGVAGKGEGGLELGGRLASVFGGGKVQIAMIDPYVKAGNPAGSCDLLVVKALSRSHEVVVFAIEFENPDPGRVTWVRIPAPGRLPIVSVLMFRAFVWFALKAHQYGRKQPFDEIHTLELWSGAGSVGYVHFCHRAYVEKGLSEAGLMGVRGFVRKCTHWVYALFEARTYRRRQQLVVPSAALRDELMHYVVGTRVPISVIPNAIDGRVRSGTGEPSAEDIRASMRLGPRDVIFCFVALGHFERKGLHIVLRGLSRCRDSRARIVVIGGSHSLVQRYRKLADEFGVAERVRFVGFIRDVHSYLLACDFLILASIYETFSLVLAEGIRAGLPVVTTRVHGVAEYLRDGESAVFFDRSVGGVQGAIERAIALSKEARAAMASRARGSVSRFSSDRVIEAWCEYYEHRPAQSRDWDLEWD